MNKKSIGFRFGDRGAHAISPRHLIHLPGYHLHPVLELRRSGTTSASQLVAHVLAARVEHFPATNVITEHSACEVEDRGSRRCPQGYQPKR